eukprot:2922604-Pyramimonas_sp.AAC.1
MKERELEKQLSASAVAKMYDEKMRYARSSERVEEGCVDCACTIYKRILMNPIANKWLEWSEQNLMEKSPWKSIYALQALIDRAQTSDKIGWAIWGITDHYRVDR